MDTMDYLVTNRHIYNTFSSHVSICLCKTWHTANMVSQGRTSAFTKMFMLTLAADDLPEASLTLGAKQRERERKRDTKNTYTQTRTVEKSAIVLVE